jgi:hypothetical protein
MTSQPSLLNGVPPNCLPGFDHKLFLKVCYKLKENIKYHMKNNNFNKVKQIINVYFEYCKYKKKIEHNYCYKLEKEFIKIIINIIKKLDLIKNMEIIRETLICFLLKIIKKRKCDPSVYNYNKHKHYVLFNIHTNYITYILNNIYGIPPYLLECHIKDKNIRLAILYGCDPLTLLISKYEFSTKKYNIIKNMFEDHSNYKVNLYKKEIYIKKELSNYMIMDVINIITNFF